MKTRISKSDIIYLTGVTLFLGVFVLIVAFPIVYVISCSFSSPEALVAGRVFIWPVEPGLRGYTAVYNSRQVWIGYYNTILYTTVYTVMAVLMTMIAAYPMSRNEFPAKKVMIWLVVVPMFINGGMIPSYLLIKNLGLMNTMWALILPGLISPWLIHITRTFLKSTIPEELFEATSIDGGSYVLFLTSIIMPLSKPIMAVLALSFATSMWNSFFAALLYITDSNKYPLQIILRNILVQNIVDFTAINQMPDIHNYNEKKYMGELLKYSLIVVSSIPMLAIYPFIQKYFIKGVMIGSIKG